MRIKIGDAGHLVKIETNQDVVLSGVYCGVGVETDQGEYWISQRDGGIVVMLRGQIVWSSSDSVTDEVTNRCLGCKHDAPSSSTIPVCKDERRPDCWDRAIKKDEVSDGRCPTEEG